METPASGTSGHPPGASHKPPPESGPERRFVLPRWGRIVVQAALMLILIGSISLIWFARPLPMRTWIGFAVLAGGSFFLSSLCSSRRTCRPDLSAPLLVGRV
jgi:hypothetical protein